MEPQNIPLELMVRSQWVAWRFDQMPDEPKPRKVPYNPRSGLRASVADPMTWGSFGEAYGMVEAGKAVGTGFVLTAGDPFACIDLDACIGPDGALSPLALAIVTRFASYTEYSPSGHGLHIWIKGAMPGGVGRNNRELGIEAYSESRFVTVTGRVLK